jgi:NTP pyrophosphatase (non-canonical NTP hydrolase)
MSEFLINNKNEIDNLCEFSANSLSLLDLKSQDLSVSKCIEIVGEIHKVIHSNEKILHILEKEDQTKRTEHILETTLYILSSTNITSILNETQCNTIKNFCNKSENVTIVLKLINWVSHTVLQKIDANGDGEVTDEELKQCCIKCCGCCPSIGNKIGNCWAWTCINICCCSCGDDSIKYKK